MQQPPETTELLRRLPLVTLASHVLFQVVIIATISFYGNEMVRTALLAPGALMRALALMAGSTALSAVIAWWTASSWLAGRGFPAVRRQVFVLGFFVIHFLLLVLNMIATPYVPQPADILRAFGMQDFASEHVLLLMLVTVIRGLIFLTLFAWVAARVSLQLAARDAAPTAAPQESQPDRKTVLGLTLGTLYYWQLMASDLGAGRLVYSDENLWQVFIAYWLVPAVVVAAMAWAFNRGLPPALRAAGCGRAVALGTISFWLTQVLGIALALAFAWFAARPDLLRMDNLDMLILLLVYIALMATVCRFSAKLLYRAP